MLTLLAKPGYATFSRKELTEAMGGSNSKLSEADIARRVRQEIKAELNNLPNYSNELRRQQDQTAALHREYLTEQNEQNARQQRQAEESRKRETKLMQENISVMQKAQDDHMRAEQRAATERRANNEQHRQTEVESRRRHEEKLEKERRERAASEQQLRMSRNKAVEEKNREILETKEAAHNETVAILERKEKEKSELQKDHLENLNEQQRQFHKQQKLTQEKFENEASEITKFILHASALRIEANKREELLREEKSRAEQEYKTQMKEKESMSKEERIKTQKRHEEYIKSKDAALEKLRDESESRMEELNEANRAQQARDIATLQEFKSAWMEREEKMHAQTMDIQRKTQLAMAAVYEQRLEDKERSHAMLFLSMKKRQDDTHQYQQILGALPRALASEQQTSNLMMLKADLHEIVSKTDDSITNLELAHGDFKKKPNRQNVVCLEEAVNDMDECVKTLHRTITKIISQIDACTSVVAATRAEWRRLLRYVQSLTSVFTRTSTKMIGLMKRKLVTLEAIDSLSLEFEKIKNQMYDLPNLDEGTVMGMIEQKQSQIMQTQQIRLKMLSISGDSSHPTLQ